MLKKSIRLFWFSEPKLMNKPKENYGDLLGKYLVEKISGKKVRFAIPKKWSIFNYFQPIYVTAGSILANINKNCIVWGSCIIQKDQQVKNATFLAVRGPQTRKRLLELGFEVPEVYGDPALLLPNYYHPKINKKYQLGIVPHYNDYKMVKQWYSKDTSIKIIDLMTLDVEQTTNEFLKCEHIISSSLHGLIVAHAYGIPAVWVKFSDKLFGDGIKFQDYFESVGIKNYRAIEIKHQLNSDELKDAIKAHLLLPDEKVINMLKEGLMRSCPFIFFFL